jgi:sulfite reductase (NADPH) hemoprotein beta-component
VPTKNAVLGQLLGPVPYAKVGDAVEKIVDAYVELRAGPGEIFLDTVKRAGVEAIRERVYAAD